MQKFSAFLFLLLSACQAPVQRTKGELIRDVKTIHLRFVLSPGKDLAQNLGTIFELRNDSGLHLAAGFQNNSQTYATSNNRILSLFCHDTLALTTKDLGRPFSEFYNGNKLFNINNQLITVNINKPYEPKKYNELSKSWEVDTVLSKLGDIYNLQIVNNQILAFLRNSIQFGSNEIFRLDDCYYLSSIYRNGSFLIFAHLINGKNQILFADWSPGDSLVIVKKYTLDSYSPEYNFPYAILDVDETHFLVGTNIGKVYLVSRDSLIEVHSRTKNEISWQPYSFLNYYNQTLIGQFPSGYLFTYNNSKIKPFYPKVEPQYWNNNHQREAQGLSLYSGKIITGVWPWGEVYSYHHDTLDWYRRKKPWMIYQHWRNEKRLFETPAVNYARGSAKLLVTPFETFFKNSLGEFNNDWGQRVPYFTVVGNKLYATTSNKGSGIKGKQLLPKSILEQYGRVIELTGKHEVSAQIDWQPEMTFDFIVSSEEMKILQDSNLIASKNFEKPINLGDLYPQMLLVGNGIYGASNVKIAKTYESFEP